MHSPRICQNPLVLIYLCTRINKYMYRTNIQSKGFDIYMNSNTCVFFIQDLLINLHVRCHDALICMLILYRTES